MMMSATLPTAAMRFMKNAPSRHGSPEGDLSR